MNSELTDAQWALIQPQLPPPKKRGRPRAQDRRTINGILYVLRTGCITFASAMAGVSNDG
jgi:transposase